MPEELRVSRQLWRREGERCQVSKCRSDLHSTAQCLLMIRINYQTLDQHPTHALVGRAPYDARSLPQSDAEGTFN